MSKQNQIGYTQDGEQTDSQITLQDRIDNEIYLFLLKMQMMYKHAKKQDNPDLEWNIEQIGSVRDKIESVLDLPDIY